MSVHSVASRENMVLEEKGVGAKHNSLNLFYC